MNSALSTPPVGVPGSTNTSLGKVTANISRDGYIYIYTYMYVWNVGFRVSGSEFRASRLAFRANTI